MPPEAEPIIHEGPLSHLDSIIESKKVTDIDEVAADILTNVGENSRLVDSYLNDLKNKTIYHHIDVKDIESNRQIKPISQLQVFKVLMIRQLM